MTDLVERLRVLVDPAHEPHGWLFEEAADEIERLREALRVALAGLHNDFEPDAQSVAWHVAKEALGE